MLNKPDFHGIIPIEFKKQVIIYLQFIHEKLLGFTTEEGTKFKINK